LGRIYRAHAPALRLYVRQWAVGDEDVVQETFLKLAQQESMPDEIIPWLYRVARNAVLEMARRKARRQRREDRVSAAESWFDSTEERIDGLSATQQLADLPLEQREVVVARIWGGLTFDEIARLTGTSLPTAHRRYQTGLATLRERLMSPCKTTTPAAKTI
jgi:RNA polymerase sigma-70 factor (ECF subfamily)